MPEMRRPLTIAIVVLLGALIIEGKMKNMAEKTWNSLNVGGDKGPEFLNLCKPIYTL